MVLRACVREGFGNILRVAVGGRSCFFCGDGRLGNRGILSLFSRCSPLPRRFLAASRLPHGFADHTGGKAIPGGSCCPIGTVEARANQEKTHFCALLLPGFYSNNLQHAALQFTLSNLNMMLQCVAIGIVESYMSGNLNKP